jgi:4-amino-4-deoxy-L-arabinose transferase-like glycosyltransferase
MENLTGRQAQFPGWCHSRWAGLALVGGVFVLAAALSWRRWPDILVDFGMQLYLPWRISEGEVLYRDMMYLTGGPLSQYFNALLFKLFGVSFRTLIFANLAITAGMLLLVYRRFLAAGDRLTATMVCLGIVLVFAFQHSGLIGNYNYITPYCHEVFHGLVLSIVVVAWLSSWIEKERIQFALAAGFGTGLVFLTKPDIFMALAVCAGTAFFAVFFTNKPVLRRNRWRHSCLPGWFHCWFFLRYSCGWKTGR